jgi:hypothetical protein
MGFLTEMLAVAVVWLSSFALCQFGVAVESACPHAKSQQDKTVARSPRGLAARPAPIAVNLPATASREA